MAMPGSLHGYGHLAYADGRPEPDRGGERAAGAATAGGEEEPHAGTARLGGARSASPFVVDISPIDNVVLPNDIVDGRGRVGGRRSSPGATPRAPTRAEARRSVVVQGVAQVGTSGRRMWAAAKKIGWSMLTSPATAAKFPPTSLIKENYDHLHDPSELDHPDEHAAGGSMARVSGSAGGSARAARVEVGAHPRVHTQAGGVTAMVQRGTPGPEFVTPLRPGGGQGQRAGGDPCL